jgi:hypothetical protein
MSERISGVAPDVLAKQLANERTRRERLEAEVLAFKARLLAGDPPDLLVDVASVILEAQTAMQAPTSGGALGERVSTGKPTSRSPVRDERPVRAFNRFKSRVDGAVNGWTVEKEKNFERDRPDPESLARVWCNRATCRNHQISIPKYHKSKKLGWIELSRICNGTLHGTDEICGSTMTDRP